LPVRRFVWVKTLTYRHHTYCNYCTAYTIIYKDMVILLHVSAFLGSPLQHYTTNTVKVKVKVTLEQATKAQRVSRRIAILFL